MNIQEILNNIKNTHYTTSEIKEKFGISPGTIRTYIMRNTVIPEDKRIKIGRQWYVEREFAENLWGLKMKNLVYLVIYNDGTNEWIEDFDSLEKANDDASYVWSQLTKNEKKTRHVYVMALTKEDYLKVKNEETEYWYGDFEVEVEGEFNSKEI